MSKGQLAMLFAYGMVIAFFLIFAGLAIYGTAR